MLLEENGRGSSGKGTRHINIRYFFIKDRIDAGEVHVVHCPTEWMVADFLTKPFQGAAFIKFRNFILNIDSQFPEIVNHRSVLGNHMNKTMPHHKGWQANGDVQQI